MALLAEKPKCAVELIGAGRAQVGRSSSFLVNIAGKAVKAASKTRSMTGNYRPWPSEYGAKAAHCPKAGFVFDCGPSQNLCNPRMALFETIQPLFVLSGFAVGFLVGMTGVGGGSLMTPLLILLFHIHPVTAVGTDLIYASVTKTGGSLVHGLNRTIDWRVVRRLATGSIPASLLTMLILSLSKVDPSSYSVLVTKVLGVSLILTAMALVFRRRLLATYSRRVGVLTEAQTRLTT